MFGYFPIQKLTKNILQQILRSNIHGYFTHMMQCSTDIQRQQIVGDTVSDARQLHLYKHIGVIF